MDYGWCSVTMVSADHSSSFKIKDSYKYAGEPAGFIISFPHLNITYYIINQLYLASTMQVILMYLQIWTWLINYILLIYLCFQLEVGSQWVHEKLLLLLTNSFPKLRLSFLCIIPLTLFYQELLNNFRKNSNNITYLNLKYMIASRAKLAKAF